MWRLTEAKLRKRHSEVWDHVIAGSAVAVGRDGAHRVVLTRTSFLPTRSILWDDYVADQVDDVYSRVVDGEIVAAVKGEDTIYIVRASILAPDRFKDDEVEKWVADYEDDWLVGPTFVAPRIVPPGENTPGLIELRL